MLYILLVLSVLGFSTITKMDYTPLKKTDYYAASKTILNNISLPAVDTAQVSAGWSKVNITPSFPFKVVGFGKNRIADGVLDSSFVRLVVFRQSALTVAYLSYDLMIVHPLIKKAVEKELAQKCPEIDHLYFTATHTHNGIGGYGDHLSGYFALGGYDQRIVDLIVSKTLVGVKEAVNSMEPVFYSYTSGEFPNLVRNRTNKQNGRIDAELTALYLKKKSGEKALLTTFSAHATMLPRTYNFLSGDYPSRLCNRIESEKLVDFALFSAGGVGSHEPKALSLSPESVGIYSQDLLWAHMDLLKKDLKFKPLRRLVFVEYDLPLRSSHFKLGKGFRLRPWVFNLVFGEADVSLTFLTLGNLTYVGTPCDFSGELALDIKENRKAKTTKPIFTSFNGGYVGYITPDEYYHWDTHEVRDVNWFGPYNGAYFKETIEQTLNKIAAKSK